ncbi:hypothetical protein HY489_05065 [Candidatus Woesearchaeota archaeon]|nr:hypothetical protein [Candidatus Woesearchaeota archaeon]
MITIIGAGKFGQCISKLLGENQHVLVDVEKDGSYSEKTKKCIGDADRLALCVPSAFLEGCLQMVKPLVKRGIPILSCTKGLFSGLKTSTEIIRKVLKNPVATLNGPNLSVEIMAGKPTLTTIAGDRAEEWASLLKSENFFPVVENDAVGAEFGAAAKNIVALGVGLMDGYYQSCNSMGSFAALAVREVEQLYKHKKKGSLPQLSFLGDLFATCASEDSRNHTYGHLVGKALREGKSIPKPDGTVEGLHALETIHEFMHGKLPLLHNLRRVLNGRMRVEELFSSVVK